MRHFATFLWLGLTVLFGSAYYAQYFRWRDCFNELGRCYDARDGVVYLEQSGGIWLTLTAIALGLFLFRLWRMRAKR
ncbi:hypothetical protein [Thioclava pacifica]|uniref:hypothetical protein n=1 Tax=Thioclava pacifica TaxID=285109 RepID=UPI000A4356BE|nr:hypothetical protein [Thioclava pacifica]